MKNQKGDMIIKIPAILIIISLIIVGVIFFINYRKTNLKKENSSIATNQTEEKYKSYTYKDGSFSLHYPESLYLDEGTPAVSISEKVNGIISNDKVINFYPGDPMISEITRNLELDKNVKDLQSLTIGGFPAKKFSFKMTSKQLMFNTYYLVKIGSYKNTEIDMIIVSYNDSSEWQKITADVVNSVNINSDKLTAIYIKEIKSSETIEKEVLNTNIRNGSSNKTDAEIQSYLGNLRAEAEVYFVNNSESYLGMCQPNSNPESKSYTVYNDLLKIKGLSGNNNVSCNSEKSQYSVSTLLKAGQFWCVDSFGYSGFVKKLNTQTVCQK